MTDVKEEERMKQKKKEVKLEDMQFNVKKFFSWQRWKEERKKKHIRNKEKKIYLKTKPK